MVSKHKKCGSKYERDVPAGIRRIVINHNRKEVTVVEGSQRCVQSYATLRHLDARAILKFYEHIGYALIVKERKYKVLERTLS